MSLLLLAQRGELEPLLLAVQEQETAGRALGSITHPKSGDCVLHVAARGGQEEVLELLLTRQVGVDVRNLEGKTPLHEAAQAGEARAVEVLLRAGAEVDAIKRADWTPLMLACTKPANSEVVSLLLEAGARTELRNKDGWTAWHIAVRTGDTQLLHLLLSSSSSSTTLSRNGRSPLHTACLAGHLPVLRLLLSTPGLDYDLNAADSCGNTPLLDAARGGSEGCMARLGEEEGLERRATDCMGRGVAVVAVQAGAVDCLELCKDWGLLEGLTKEVGQFVLALSRQTKQM